MTLDDAVKRLYDELPKTHIITPFVAFWGKNDTCVISIVNKFCELCDDRLHVWGFKYDPFPMNEMAYIADMIVKVRDNKLEVQKNRYGKNFTLDYEPEEPAMSDNSGRWTYKHLKPDSAGYAECFRILREAVKDGIIRNWYYGTEMPDGYPGIDVHSKNGHGFEASRDTDGTKGDIGLLREAADYVLELKHQKWLESQPIHPFDGMDIKEAFRVLNKSLENNYMRENTTTPKNVSEMSDQELIDELATYKSEKTATGVRWWGVRHQNIRWLFVKNRRITQGNYGEGC